ncbi:hypothetical protein Goshw_006986, partial [Gossypium schwendimanii]|nr:hypothetical protein [Gossypium schwendimanii]
MNGLGFRGQSFTWHRGGIHKRLDRAIVNNAWLTNFPNCLVTHLPRIKFDHRPLLLSLRLEDNFTKGRSFRFVAGWVEHHNFLEFVKFNWNFNGDMTASFDHFTLSIKHWNKLVYGHIGNRKSQLVQKLSDVQRKMERFDSTFLCHLEMKGKENFENILYHEDPLETETFGSDGFHALLFQNQWDLIGLTICNWVKMVFARKAIDPDLNNTLIVLIPKTWRRPTTGFVKNSLMFLSMLQNGVPTYKFRPAKGIRHGCPLSSYIFVLCMEWLSHNGLIIFGQAEMQQANIIKETLEKFCRYSGHQINKRKTNMFFSKGISEDLGDQISRRSIKCWLDPWLPNVGPLVNKVPFHENLEKDCLLKDMVTKNGSWNLELLRLWLSDDIIAKIMGIPPPNLSAEADKIIPWNFQGPQRVRLFICMVLKNHLLTNLERVRRALEAELWAIFDGLTLILDWRHDKVLMNTNSMEVVRATQYTYSRDSNSTLIRRIRQLLTNAEQWHIQHILREDNKVADYLAKTACNNNNDIKLFDQPP